MKLRAFVCNKNLRMEATGELAFKKGSEYREKRSPSLNQEGKFTRYFVDSKGSDHSVSEGLWLNYFSPAENNEAISLL